MAATEITLSKTLTALPDVQRGYGFNMYADGKKGDRLTYCNDKTVILRSLEDETESKIFVGEHKMKVNVAKASPNGEWIASGDAGGRLLIWGQGNQSIKSDFPINKSVLDVSWDCDGKRILVAGNGSEGMAKVVAWDTGSALGNIGGHQKAVLSCDYKQTRPFRVITGSEDMACGFFEGPPFKLNRTVRDHKNYVNKVAYAPSGELFATVSSDMSIRIYDGKTSDVVKVLGEKDGHKGSVYSFAWSPDSTQLLTASADKTAKLWDVESGECVQTFTFNDKPTVQDMQLCALWFGEYMITLSLSGAINYLDVKDPTKPKKVVMGHVAPVDALAVDRSKGVYYTGDGLGVLCRWDGHKATWFTGKGHGKAIRDLSLSPDGSKIASVGSDDKLIVSGAKECEFNGEAMPLGGTPSCVQYANNSELLAIGLAQDKIIMMKDGEVNAIPTEDKPFCLAFNADDSKLAVGFQKFMRVYAVDGVNLKEERVYKELTKKVTSIKWTADGKLIASGDNRQILVFDGEDQKNPSDWEFHTGAVTNHALSPDGSKVASVSNDLTLLVWTDTEKWSSKRGKMLMAHREGIKFVEFLDDNTLLTVGCDSCLKVWTI